jgi:hypothetical protein
MGDVGSALGPATGLEPAMNKTRTEDHYEHCACLWVGANRSWVGRIGSRLV